jgi:hypothetical protein
VAVISFYLAFHYFVFGPLCSIKIVTYLRSFEKEIMLRYGSEFALQLVSTAHLIKDLTYSAIERDETNK